MKQYIFLLVLLGLATCATMAQQAEQTALNGDEMYRQGDYAGAIQSYNEAIAQGRTSANLYYNLGNAYYRIDDMPHAILNYERAIRLKPSMNDAKENLALAQSKTVDRIEQLPKLFVVRIYDNLCTHITPPAWRTIWLVLLALLTTAVTGIFVCRSLKMRRRCFGASIVALLLLLVTTVLLVSSTRRFNGHAGAIVMQQSLTVKSSPENQSADKLILHEGTHVHIDETWTDWCKITIADGTSGWCKADAIERI